MLEIEFMHFEFFRRKEAFVCFNGTKESTRPIEYDFKRIDRQRRSRGNPRRSLGILLDHSFFRTPFTRHFCYSPSFNRRAFTIDFAFLNARRFTRLGLLISSKITRVDDQFCFSYMRSSSLVSLSLIFNLWEALCLFIINRLFLWREKKQLRGRYLIFYNSSSSAMKLVLSRDVSSKTRFVHRVYLWFKSILKFSTSV